MFGIDDAIAIPALTGLAEGAFNAISQGDTNASNIKFQQDFAQHGLGWKADDARAHGISPLVALGAPTAQFQSQVAPNLGGSLEHTGQDISRALMAQESPIQKQVALENLKGIKLANAGADMDVKIKQAQLAKMLQPAQPPGIPDAFVPVKMPDGTIIKVPSRELAPAGFFPWLNQGLGIYGSGLALGGYGQRAGKAMVEPLMPGSSWHPPMVAPSPRWVDPSTGQQSYGIPSM